eukprot:TRINITY_DN11674_c3_g1_i1.p2 TRINITY_DN11674_c3_g1~~TRINITY_DN11674_c3_g1_i1.p2  ORF type:complete len:153 (+),score=30.93 TRINITY_DN11674_c3_g1_i1:1407-1865(+)
MEVCALVDRLKLACHHDAYQRTQMPVGAQHFFITDAKSDPYVKFTCLEPMLPPKRKYKTTVKVGTLNPTWTSDELPLFDTVLGTMSLLQTRCVQMHLFDSDLMSANDYLGSASVSLADLSTKGMDFDVAVVRFTEQQGALKGRFSVINVSDV